jgi:hypothetical protein
VDAELYGRAAVSGAVWLGDCFRRLFYAGGANRRGKAAYSTLLFPLVALTISTFYEGYVWHSNAVAGLALILVGNLVMFARPEQWLLRRRLAWFARC